MKMSMMFVDVAFVIFMVLLIIIASFYIYRRIFAFQFFIRQSIPCPTPHWLLGNVAEFADANTRHLVIPKWTQTYGKLFGFYEGSRPTLVTSDVNFVTQVFIKQSAKFHGRKLFPLQPNPDSTNEPMTMLVARGERWKRLRTIVNAAFSASKMRLLMPLMSKCQNDFMALIDHKAQNEQEFNIFDCFQLLTLDIISEAAFGIELNSVRSGGEENPLLDTLHQMFHQLLKTPLTFKLAIIIPELSNVMRRLEFVRAKLFGTGFLKLRNILVQMVTEIITLRKANPTKQKRQDLLQIMLEMEESRLEMINGLKALSIGEITGQSMLFMIAGYETSSNTLAFISFLLANFPDVQDKVMAEIDAKFAGHPEKNVDYDLINDLPYMDCVINETLRLYPVAPLVVTRLAMESTEVNGITIPEGLPVMADVWSLHRDEEQWGPIDPNSFYPERFLEDYPTHSTRNDAAFIPFGIGPRKCVGMRFALLEMKLILVNLLRKYRIVKSPRTGDTLKLQAAFTITTSDGIWVKLSKRWK